MGLSRNLSLILGGFTAVTYMLASFIPLWVRLLIVWKICLVVDYMLCARLWTASGVEPCS